jgi:hypothetical protein
MQSIRMGQSVNADKMLQLLMYYLGADPNEPTKGTQ